MAAEETEKLAASLGNGADVFKDAFDDYEGEKVERTVGDAQRLADALVIVASMLGSAARDGIDVPRTVSFDDLRVPGGLFGPQNAAEVVTSMARNVHEDMARVMTGEQYRSYAVESREALKRYYQGKLQELDKSVS